MPWVPHPVRNDPELVELKGPLGDRLAVRFTGPVPGYGGCEWRGVAARAMDGTPVGDFTFIDASTPTELDLTVIVEDTSVWDVGCKYLFKVCVVDGPPAPTTVLRGHIIPEPSLPTPTP